MKASIAYVGDEIGAAGWRLAGAAVQVVAADAAPVEAALALARSRDSFALVLLSAAVAARVPPAQLQAALVATEPLLVVLPDTFGRASMPSLAARLRTQLGSVDI